MAFNMDFVEMEEAATKALITLGIKSIWPRFKGEALWDLDEHQLALWVPLEELIPEVGADRTIQSLTPAINMMGQIVARAAWNLSRPGEEMEVEQNDLSFVRFENPKLDDSLLFEGKVIKTKLGHRATFTIKMWRKKQVTIANGMSSLSAVSDDIPIIPPVPIAAEAPRTSESSEDESSENPTTSPPQPPQNTEKPAPTGKTGPSTSRSVDAHTNQVASDPPTTSTTSEPARVPIMDSDENPGVGPSTSTRRNLSTATRSQPPTKKIRASLLPRLAQPPPLAIRMSAPAAPQPMVPRIPPLPRQNSNAIPTRRVSFANIGDDDRVISVHRFALINVRTSHPQHDKTLENLAARLGFTPRNVRFEIMPVTLRNRYMYHFEVFGWREERKVASGYRGEHWSYRLDPLGYMARGKEFLHSDITIEQFVEALFLAQKAVVQLMQSNIRWPRRDDLHLRLSDTSYIKEALKDPKPGQFTKLKGLLSARGRIIFESFVKPRARTN